ncbi:hypothetical protein AHF37_11816 [Paragonimus kellicotti]|nr:hypothetical protein AHF37_11816 [Paragonimus kellicotti]
MYSECPQACQTEGNQLPLIGINSGIMLLDLRKLRQLNWTGLWKIERDLELTKRGTLAFLTQVSLWPYFISEHLRMKFELVAVECTDNIVL